MRNFLSVIALMVTYGPLAFAGLGENQKSCDRDRKLLAGTVLAEASASSATGVKVCSFSANGGGQSIREYISSTGTVFAITWRGIAHPDLRVLLGKHYAEYIGLTQARLLEKRRQAIDVVRTGEAVVIRGGHMREITGRTYLPGQVPAGINPGSLQ